MRAAADFVRRNGRAGCVVGLPEELVAMLFGQFSRSVDPIEVGLQRILDDGELPIESLPAEPTASTERSRRFHERITIGYGHKSVGDHAMVHFLVDGGSALYERHATSARLAAFTSKSTRYVDFSKAGWVVPDEAAALKDEYSSHCSSSMSDYSGMMAMAIEAVRKAYPFDDSIWKRGAWESATEKRALDAIRDLLPASIKTSLAGTMSATAMREHLDRSSTERFSEIRSITDELGLAARIAAPTLLPVGRRSVPHHRPLPPPADSGVMIRRPTVSVRPIHDWRTISAIMGCRADELVAGWQERRERHMVPDRTSELPEYDVDMCVPFAIARDLGRHRPVTQLWSDPMPSAGFGRDPIMSDPKLASDHPMIGLLSEAHRQALVRSRARTDAMMSRASTTVLSYASPLATMVRGVWRINLREMVHVIGLRTTPQGHPAYRAVSQAMSKHACLVDPVVAPLLKSVTNDSYVLVGRPG